MKEKKKIPWGLLYVLLTVIILVVFGMANQQFLGMFSVIANLSGWLIVLAVVMTVVFFLLEGGIIELLLACQGDSVGILQAMKIGLIGIYYSYITPSSTGGQPAQVVYLLRKKVTVGNSAAVLFMKFFAYQLAFVLCSVASLLFMYPHLQSEKPDLIPLVLLGILINSLWIIFIPLLFHAPILHKMCGALVALVNKLKFLKKRQKYVDKIRGFEADFASYTEKFSHKKRYVVFSVLLSIPQVVLQMSVLYVVFYALNQTAPYVELLSLQTLLQVAVCYVPLPGASGAQELGFTMFFGSYFSADMIYSAVMVWRFFTYYLIVILGAVVVMIDQILFDRKKKKAGKS